ncbi:origin recognition complex subunit 4 [Acrasis kona]|uniref:Small ribosomal subunit protein mS29 n=1 Tax=Acrasis kona TaxID=1008807 RepID=A0AAW2YVN5_9EUKA
MFRFAGRRLSCFTTSSTRLKCYPQFKKALYVQLTNDQTSESRIVQRQQMVECYEKIKAVKNKNAFGDPELNRPILIIGPKGAGKTTILNGILDKCVQDGWITIQMPNGKDWTRRISDANYAENLLIESLTDSIPDLIIKYKEVHPEIAQVLGTWLKKIEDALAECKDPSDITFEFFDDLKAHKDHPILLIYDDYQYLTNSSSYRGQKLEVPIYSQSPFISVIFAKHWPNTQILKIADQTRSLLDMYPITNKSSQIVDQVVEASTFSQQELEQYLSKQDYPHKDNIHLLKDFTPEQLEEMLNEYGHMPTDFMVEQYEQTKKQEYDAILSALEEEPHISGGYPPIGNTLNAQREKYERLKDNKSYHEKLMFQYDDTKTVFYQRLFNVIVPVTPFRSAAIDSIIMDNHLVYRQPAFQPPIKYKFYNQAARRSIQQNLANHVHGLKFNFLSNRSRDLITIMKPLHFDANEKLRRKDALCRELFYRLLEIQSNVDLPTPPPINLESVPKILNEIIPVDDGAESKAKPKVTASESKHQEQLTDEMDLQAEKVKQQQEDQEELKKINSSDWNMVKVLQRNPKVTIIPQTDDEFLEMIETEEERMNRLERVFSVIRTDWFKNINRPAPLLQLQTRHIYSFDDVLETVQIGEEGDAVSFLCFEDGNPSTCVKAIESCCDESDIKILIPERISRSNNNLINQEKKSAPVNLSQNKSRVLTAAEKKELYKNKIHEVQERRRKQREAEDQKGFDVDYEFKPSPSSDVTNIVDALPAESEREVMQMVQSRLKAKSQPIIEELIQDSSGYDFIVLRPSMDKAYFFKVIQEIDSYEVASPVDFVPAQYHDNVQVIVISPTANVEDAKNKLEQFIIKFKGPEAPVSISFMSDYFSDMPAVTSYFDYKLYEELRLKGEMDASTDQKNLYDLMMTKVEMQSM